MMMIKYVYRVLKYSNIQPVDKHTLHCNSNDMTSWSSSSTKGMNEREFSLLLNRPNVI